MISSMDKKTIVVVGAGQGLGNHVAKRFGKEGFRVVLMARNEKSLESYRQDFMEEGIETYVYVVDAEQPDTLTAAFKQEKLQFGAPDVFIYNVGITTPDEKGKIDNIELMRHYQVDVASAYHCVCQVADEEFSKKKGTIIVTGGGLALYPNAAYLPLSLDKAALRAMVYALHEDLASKEIFIGTVTVCGTIGGDEFFAPSRIADVYWAMYNQRKNCEIVYKYPEVKQ